MTETLAALLLAHVAADFLLQPDRMVANKRKPLWFALHAGLVLGTALAATGSLHPALFALAAAHAAIDAVKLASRRSDATAFALDQAAHLATLALTAALFPGLFAAGLWGSITALPAAFALIAGAIWTIRAGGYAIGHLMAPWAALITLDGLPNGGRAIGQLERGLIFLMILGGLPEGIGFLIAAKSVLRFGTVREEAKLSEYVIIGTLASFAWALVSAWATLALISTLPPLGIPAFPP
ncbi:DUF3307 domain-containing protein [Tabrizicola sp. TH137]|uniref:DUF3307 domain-containing protein n=1 Tax=Tabrizicola sp. TH137 TaxID=2067452 RepID=UPI000C7C591B|nr:DUF3307 domain-containing protein [Tabrizicola sp. TH137]PLL13542.1 DUF3307 domain-containing protein [Tabrizicola sp. TH137]